MVTFSLNIFKFYISDLPDCVTYSEIALFADDTKMYIPIQSKSDYQKFQTDLKCLSQWSERWEMTFNISKCNILAISHEPQPLYLRIFYPKNRG